jgi:galactose mutarotase-like enzyme
VAAATAAIEIGAAPLHARIAARGAELIGLRCGAHELLWHGDPRHWDRISPILFPIIGRANGEAIRIEGRVHAMPMHGFARDGGFDVVAATATSCTLALGDSAQTRVHFPYAFRLVLRYAVAGRQLTVRAELANPGPAPLPASLGFHPGFRWPLVPGRPKTDYAVRFSDDGDDLVAARPHDGILHPDRTVRPLVGGALRLHEPLFGPGALVFLARASRWIDYGAPGDPLAIRVAAEGLPQLAIWSRPPGDFVCLEPWCGHPEPAGFAGAFADKPGLIVVPPGAVHAVAMTIAVMDGGPA